ncbi:MAG: GDSL-type esterase/lipase family protein [Euryarchaeota archaeon]|nr:GDSL-type esterase/lipase family protein [Euryarchaeota archaeon]
MNQKLAKIIAIAMLVATVAAYSNTTQGNSTARNSTKGNTPSNTTSPPVTALLHPLHAHRIVCLGDSITEGFADPDNWPYHLKARFGGGREVVDQGVGGAFTADMLDRVDVALALNPRFVVLAGGMNDLMNGEPLEGHCPFQNLKR